MKIAVLDAETLGDDLDFSPLSEFGEVVIYRNSPPDTIAEHLKGCEAAVINNPEMNERTIGKADSLRLVCVFATGYDKIDLAYCRKRGIAVCNIVGYSTESVAQVTLAMALSLVTRLPSYSGYVASGAYSESGVANRLTPVFHEIGGMTWGIAGYGRIGRRVGEIARALGCRVLAFRRRPADDGVKTVSLDTLCRESDILSVHLPLTAETRGLIGENEIARMKPDAVFLNLSRGAVTDEAALARAVAENRIGALGVDVFSREPFPPEHPFTSIMDRDNVCLTPHIGWGAKEARERGISEICANIRSFLCGENRNRVDLL